MSILVTGGAGYIGSHVLSLLKETKRNVVVLDNLTTGRLENLIYGKLVLGDLSDLELMEDLFRHNKFEAVIHFAGSIVVPESITNPSLYYHNNTQNSFSLMNLCLKYNVQKFIFSSTAAVYGMPESGVASEETMTNPINPYGRSKLMTEWMLEDISKAHNLRYVALRYFNVAGASKTGLIGQSTPRATHLIKTASELACGKRDSMRVFGTDYNTPDGSCIRDYIHVDDLALAHIDALTYLEDGGKSQIFNCGYGSGYSVLEVIDTIEKVSGKKLQVEMDGRRAGDAVKLIAHAEKIKEVLGWAPKYNDLSYIVKTAYEWEQKLKS